LLDFAIHEAEKVQRYVQLYQIGVDEHEIAHREATGYHAASGHRHQHAEADADDRGLADVEQRQRALACDGRPLVARERLVEAIRFVMLIAEVFHGLVIQQAVDRARIRLLVGLVHLTPVLEAPFRDGECVSDVAGHAGQRHDRVPHVEHRPENAADQRHLDQRRHDVEQHERQQRIDTRGTALDGARQPAGLAFEVKRKRQRMEMAEGSQRDLTDRALRHLRERGVAQLRKRDRRHAE
jgi:hypothetical protein